MECTRELESCTRAKGTGGIPCQPTCPWPHPATQDLVDGSAFLECTLCNDLGSHLLHVKHEGIEGFFDGWLLSLLLCLGFCLCFPGVHNQITLLGKKAPRPCPGSDHYLMPPIFPLLLLVF